jgi:putative transposase
LEIQLLTYKYRLNPTRQQHRALETILEQQRQLANAALAEREDFYRKNREAFLNRKTHKEQCALYRKRIKAWMKTAQKSKERGDSYLFQNQRTTTVKLILEYRSFRKLAPSAPRSITAVDQSKSLTAVRAAEPAFNIVQRRIQRNTLNEVDRSYQAVFRRIAAGQTPGFPHFKGRDFFVSFGFDAFQQITLTQQKDSGLFSTKARKAGARYARIRFAGMKGGLRVWLDRELPSAPKRVWFKREDNRWFVGFQVERECLPERKSGKEIGVDWGTSALAVLSTGEVIGNPRFGELAAPDLVRTARKVARAKKGSKNRRKARIAKRRIERKTTNRRKNCLNKLTKRLTTHFRFVATEEFSTQAMMANGADEHKAVRKRRNREALDAAPYMTRQMIAYKAKLYGGIHGLGGAPCAWPEHMPKPENAAKEDKRSSTEVCCMCWATLDVSLSDARIRCYCCGNSMPRKHNSACVILIRAQIWAGPVPEGANRSNGCGCPRNTGGRLALSPGRRPSGLHPNATGQAVNSG